MKLTINFLLLLVFCTTSIVAKSNDQRDSKFFVFNYLRFKNEPCNSTSLATGGITTRIGTCYTEAQCKDRNGIKSGSCAGGFGICCVFVFDIGPDEDINQNGTYLKAPQMIDDINNCGTQCLTLIRKSDEDVVSLRLDFVAFNLAGPANTREAFDVCRDSFLVSSFGNIPNNRAASYGNFLCGQLTGQHMYIDFVTDKAFTVLRRIDPTVLERTFEVKLTQITSYSPMRPPDGCTQWYTGTHGRLTSFNFESNTQHLSSLNYNICIRKEKGFCCIKYDVCPDENSFSFHATGGNMALVEENCRTDYLTIEGSSSICRLNRLTNRYCGEFLADENKVESNLQICDCTAPFIVRFDTDFTPDGRSATSSNRGFCLNYVQTPC